MASRIRVARLGGPLAGVAVSDGRQVARTDARGRAMLPGAGEGLVFVSTPSGMRPVGPWYAPAAAEVAFRLEPDPAQGVAFDFAFFTDIHLLRPEESGDAGQPFEAVLTELAEGEPAFCVSGGDIEIQAGMGEAYAAMLSEFPLPVYHVLGNHELLVSRPNPRAEYGRLFGPTRYSWNYGGAHFVVLDGLTAHSEETGWRAVHGEVTAEELSWLRADLRAAPPGAPVIVFLHIPPYSTFGLRRGKPWGAEPAWEVRGRDRLTALLAQFNTKLVLSGHFHENEHVCVHGIEFIASGAVCGQWWERGGRPPVNVDGSPKGYRLVHVAGESVRSAYVATGGGDPLRIVGPRPGEAVAGEVRIGVNVFDGDARWEVAYRLDGEDWRPLRFRPQRARRNVFSNAHFWAGRAEIAGLGPGECLIEVRARGTGGEEHAAHVNFEWRGAG